MSSVCRDGRILDPRREFAMTRVACRVRQCDSDRCGSRQRFVPFCSMKVKASNTVRKPPREPSTLVSALE
jgi:hypothetical protein